MVINTVLHDRSSSGKVDGIERPQDRRISDAGTLEDWIGDRQRGVTYDRRFADAASASGLRVVQPGL